MRFVCTQVAFDTATGQRIYGSRILRFVEMN